MSWKEVVLYLGLAAITAGAGALKLLTPDATAHILGPLVTFVIGRMVPTKSEEKTS